jgi:ADP-ribosylglycohydrolase
MVGFDVSLWYHDAADSEQPDQSDPHALITHKGPRAVAAAADVAERLFRNALGLCADAATLLAVGPQPHDGVAEAHPENGVREDDDEGEADAA